MKKEKYLVVNSFRELIKEISIRKNKTVILQAPDGLRNKLIRVYELLRNKFGENLNIIIDGERRFGGCDLPVCLLNYFADVDAIIHFGHYPFLSKVPLTTTVYYLLIKEKINLRKKLMKEIQRITSKEGKVGILYPPQYSKLADEVNRYIGNQKLAKETILSEIIGCEYEKIKELGRAVDTFIVVSPGLFYGLGPLLWTGKETYVIDPYKQQITNISKYAKKYLSLIAYNISKFKDVNNVGIIVVLKSGQFNFKVALDIKKKLEKKGKRAYLIAMEEITPEKIRYFIDIDLFIQTGCPRISIDNIESFDKPILNIRQALIALGELRFEEVYGDATTKNY